MDTLRSRAIASASKLPPPLPPSKLPADHHSVSEQLKKAYKRIADLETRVNDLTVMSNISDIADDNDVSYMERSRLEAEFKKLKELKKKAESFAIEAKQTAQRLSAENFKLKEDNIREKHYNEITRKSIIREVELDTAHGLKAESMELIRSDVFKDEVMKRAQQMMQDSPLQGHLYEKVDLSVSDIKKIIMTQSVRMNLFHIVLCGLPWSGKSTLVTNILPFEDKTTKSAFGLELHEAILQRNVLTDTHTWMRASQLQDNIFTTSTILAHLFATHNQLPKFEMDTSIDQVFDDLELQGYFETTYKSLQKILLRLQSEKDVENILTGSLSFVNIFDIGVNNAVHEFLMAVGSQNNNHLLINMLNISKHDAHTLKQKLKLDDEEYCGRYKQEENSYYQRHNALYHFMTSLEAGTQDCPQTNAIIVGTHWDSDHVSVDTIRTRREEIMELVNSYAVDIGVPTTSFLPDMMILNMSDEKDFEKLKDEIISLMKLNKKVFEKEVPVKFLFLRWVLFNTKKLFISRTELSQYAKKISIDTEEEVESFLGLFRGCGSIISSPLKAEFLYSYVILLPIKFIRGLNKMYCVHTDTSLPDEVRKPTAFGIVSEELVRSVWQGPVEGSLTPSELYVSVLKNVGLMMDLEGKYFMPSLRLEFDDNPPKQGSLFITTNISFRKQCSFLKNFISYLKDRIRFTECPYQNISTFDWIDGEKIPMSIKFTRDYIQISVDKANPKICSTVKTVCVAVMNSIADFKPSLRHELCIVCPNEHFVPFDVLDSSIMELKCQKCSKVISKPSELEWITCAYTGTRRSASHSDDLLIPTNLLKICKQLSSLSIDDITRLAEKMGVLKQDKQHKSPEDEMLKQFKQHKSPEDVLFCVLYNWHCKNPSATKKTLAKVLNDCKYHDKAVAMDPTLFGAQTDKKVYSTELSSKQLLMISDSWPSDWKELNDILKVSASDLPQKSSNFDKCFHLLCKWMKKTDGDKIGKLAQLFKEEEYHNMSDLILTFHF